MRQARGRLLSAAITLGALSAVVAWSPAAEAQEGRFGKMSERGFGNRDEFDFSVERVFGFIHQDFGDDSVDTLGLHPVYWGSLGLWGVMDSGLTFGALLGASHITLKDSDGTSELNFNIFAVEPRIGYAAAYNSVLSFWIRGGPSFHLINSKFTFTLNGTEQSSSQSDYLFGVGGEAYAVITPVPHVGILFGPHAMFNVAGSSSRDCPSGETCPDPKYTTYGLSFGLMGEFY